MRKVWCWLAHYFEGERTKREQRTTMRAILVGTLKDMFAPVWSPWYWLMVFSLFIIALCLHTKGVLK